MTTTRMTGWDVLLAPPPSLGIAARVIGQVHASAESVAERKATRRYPYAPHDWLTVRVSAAKFVELAGGASEPQVKRRPQGFACKHVQDKAHGPDASTRRQATRKAKRDALTPSQLAWRRRQKYRAWKQAQQHEPPDTP